MTSVMALAGILLVLSCGDGAVEPALPPPPPAPVATSVTVNPASATLTALGETVRLTAEVRDQNGQVMAGAAVAWASSDASVAGVDASGLVTAAANGSATITATSGSASGSATVTVTQEVSAVTVTPATASLTALGDTLRLAAEAVDANGNAVAGAESSWESSNDSVATVDASGLVTAVANGSATIMATSGSSSGSATVTVTQEVSAVTVTPATASLTALGDTLRLAAEAVDANGNAVAGAESSWESSNDSVATVDASGLVTAVANGSATIMATSGSASGSAPVTVTQEVSAVTVTPATASLAALGDTLRLAAEAVDANGNAVAGAEFTWESSNDSVATVNASGLVTALANGSATITATSGSVSGSAVVSLAQAVSTVTVVPDTATVVEGDTLRLEASATDSNGQVVTGVAFAWASGETAVAEVDSTGLATGIGAGQAQVTATTAGVMGHATLTVLARVPTTVSVTPDTVMLTMLGQTAQLSAEVRDQSGRVMDRVPVVWSSADATVAAVDSAGLVTAMSGGVVTITATTGEVSGDAVVSVTQSVDAVTVSPPADTIAPGDTLRMVAEAYDQSGHVVAGAVFTWSSSNATVATVDPSGLVRGAGDGTATITAAAGEALGASEITVESPDRAALVALYEATDGPNWTNNENWLTDAPLGEWYGVETDATGRVVRLRLYGNGLTGIIPPDLGNLTNLTDLSFWDNQLWGTIPPELGRLASLRGLVLGVNALTGEIPPELGSLTRLTTLQLRLNELTGPIPAELGNLTELQQLDLYRNELTGPIPTELSNLAELQILTLGSNQLTGQIPVELGTLSKLRSLYLAINELTGPVPPELGNLVNLESLSLFTNNLTGQIPPELGNLTKLEGLGLSSNDLTGRIPAELGNLVNLFSAYFGDNRLTGAIPRSFLQLDSLQTLGCARSDGVCVPATAEFREWVREVEARSVGRSWVDVPWCDETEKLVLEILYEAANGPEWTSSDGWLEGGDLADWHGVSTDSVTGRISGLDLAGNGLSGRLPQALRQLVGMTQLKIGSNALSGPLPLSFAELPLEEFDYRDTSLCVADDPEFESWLAGIAVHRGTGVQCPPLTARDILELLHANTRGSNWSEREGWLTDAPLSKWHGVETDVSGRVVALSLPENGLSGSIPAELGQLPELGSLDLRYNALSGVIPPELGDLDRLEQLDLSFNTLSGPLPVELGKLTELQRLRLRGNRLSGSIPSELGGMGRLHTLHLSRNQFAGEIPVELGRLSELRDLRLGYNPLGGSIPAELGDLRRLEYLALSHAGLSGEIPERLSRLGDLRVLRLDDNRLTGPIPSGVANLARLHVLELSRNRLTGPIPSGLGDLADLTELHLGDNQLAGPLPVELGRAGRLQRLDLRSNALAGPIPAEYSNLTDLKQLILAHNAELSGPLPQGLTKLGQLERFMAGGTDLCLPVDPGFDAWFGTIAHGYVARCRGGPAVYLTQATQSWEDPVPLLAGEPALLRVFVTGPSGTDVTMPDVVATFHVDGFERHTVRIPASAQVIPSDVVEGDLAMSVNAEIPAEVIAPGLEMVIEVDPDRTLDSALGVSKRIPESGRMPIDVRAVPPLQLTLVPFLWEGVTDSTAVQSVNEMAEDASGGHELLRDVRTLLPVAELEVTAHEPVSMSHSNANQLLAQIEAMRLMEGGSGYWMGVVERRPGARSYWFPGQARGEHVSYVMPANASTMAHELGHNLGLLHAPCGNPGGVDPWFPHPAGRIGAWGFDLDRNALVRPTTPDLMSYCGSDNEWVSDYHFNKMLIHRLANDGAAAAGPAGRVDPVKTLLLWGGLDADGVPFLDPAFVADAVPSLPSAGTVYSIEGADADGTLLFSYAFDMQATADVEGEEAGFVFTLPLQVDWASDLARITLSGPGGSAVLDESTDRPMAILRNPQTGQVRGFLRDLPVAGQAAADAVAGTAGRALETLFSRGIPSGEAWRR